MGLVLALALPAAGGDDDESAHRGAIRIDGAGLTPEVYEGRADDVISWSNEDEQYAVLSFPEGFLAHLRCEDAGRPQLREDASGRVLSLPIRSLPFALPCPLEPGRYAYRVHLVQSAGPPGAPIAPPGPVRNPRATFEGELIVR
jgi:hypothetical protein